MSVITPSGEQRAILDLGLTTIKVRAGAGTGKTTTVALVIANLVAKHGVAPEQVVGLTFTNKAAAELADRVRSFLGTDDPARQAEIHTYHGFAAQLLSEFGALVGLDSRYQVITPTFARQILTEVVNTIPPLEHLDLTWATRFDWVRTLGDRLGDHLLTPEDLLAYDDTSEKAAHRREMALLLREYEKEKRRLGVVDFSDLVRLAARLMTQNTDLANLVRNRYRVVVLDEYQDTNPAQRVLLQAVFGKKFPVIAVGDEDQTIYEWRGASTENFANFEDHFETPEGSRPHLASLTLNRRSTSTILEVANRIRRLANPGAEDLTSALPDDPGSTIRTHWAQNSIAEAQWIAARFEELHESGVAWRDMAILLRKNKDFSVIVDAFARHDIPVEVANVGGLLSVPEVADLVAWLSILEHPDDSASLITILMGSRFRWGLADLARLAWRARHGDEEDTEGNPIPITLLEAVEHDVPGLRAEAADSLADFRQMYRRILLETQGLTLAETCRLILDVTGGWRDIEALPPTSRLTARLNLYRFLDLAQDWSPLQGRPSLPAFLEYLETTKDDKVDELDQARVSGEDAVTLLTVHRAKGLEWDVVAIPAVYEKNFPSSSVGYGNPLTTAQTVPIELRLDTVMAHLPDDDKDAIQDHLKAAHVQQEWRTAYVAATRARRHLFVTGAHWYGYPMPNQRPSQPSELWEQVNAVSGDVTELPPRAEPPELLKFETSPTPDPHFPEGWDGAMRMALADPSWAERISKEMNVETEFRTTVSEVEQRLFSLGDPVPTAEEPSTRPVSVTGLVTYAQCPRRFYWSEVDPLPRRVNPAAVRGTEIHRRIELHQKGIVPLAVDDVPIYDMVGEEPAAPGAFETFLGSRFANRRTDLIEQPFNLEAGGTLVRGRIDAVYVDDSSWEIVDFKSGQPKEDPARIVQLQAYAVAADTVDFGIPRPERVTVTFAHLGGGGSEESHLADRAWTDEATATLERLVEGISSEVFTETPGPWCEGCDFLRFCDPGRSFLGG